jgi:hypothetical protein
MIRTDEYSFAGIMVTGFLGSGRYKALKNSCIIVTSSTVLVTLKLLKFYFALISKHCLMGV